MCTMALDQHYDLTHMMQRLLPSSINANAVPDVKETIQYCDVCGLSLFCQHSDNHLFVYFYAIPTSFNFVERF